MLETMEQVREANKVMNGIDDPNLMSVDSTAVLPLEVDKVNPADETGEIVKEAVPIVIAPSTTATPSAEEKEKLEKEKLEKEVKATEEKKVTEEKKPLPEQKTETKDAVQKRIDEITKKRRAAERERDFEKEQRRLDKEKVDKLEEELKQLKSKVDPVASGKPQKADFEDVEDYVEALATWKAEQVINSKAEKVKEVEVEEKVKQEKQEAYAVLDEALERGRIKYDDFNDVALNKEVKITPDLVETILDSEIAEDIMYYLGKNPDEASDLSKLNSRRAAREVTKIEAKLLADAAADKRAKPQVAEEIKPEVPKPNDAQLGDLVPEPKKVTSAPEPIVPVRTTGAFDKDPNSMSPKEYRAWRERNKQ